MNVPQLIEYGLLVSAAGAILCVVLATIYDFRRLYHEPALRERLRKLTNTRQPHVTIIVRVKNSTGVVACLSGIAESQYYKYDIVLVLDKRATREMKRTVRTIVGQPLYLKSPIHTYIARRQQKGNILLRRAYARSHRGEFIMCLDASQMLEPGALKRAVAWLSMRPTSTGVILSEYVETVSSLKELSRTFAVLSRRLITKAISTVGLYRSRNLNGGIYQRQVFLRATRGRTIGVSYDSGALISGVTTRSVWWKSALSVVGGITFLGVVLYSGLLAATLQTTTPLWMSWVILILWLFATIWFDDTTRLRYKTALTLTLPVSYFAIAGVVLIGAIEKLIRRINVLTFMRDFSHTDNR